MTVLAELLIRHTRKHMPTRRVALGSAYLPMSGPAYGGLLLGALVNLHVDALDEDQLAELPKLLEQASRGLVIPRIALRHRLQTDTHGLDRSRHRVVEELGTIVVELDVHGGRVPQVLGAILAASELPPTPRVAALGAIRRAIDGRFRYPRGVMVRRLLDGLAPEAPWAPNVAWRHGRPTRETLWDGVPSDRRWAMEVLGFVPGIDLERDEINRRFRRLLRAAHPDSGGARDSAAERIAELSEARELLLFDLVDAGEDESVVFSAGE
jgi:hypothetical protein